MNDNSAALFGGMSIIAVLIFYAVILGLVLTVYFKIVSKAGYPGWYCLLMLVPCVNLVALLMFAFTEWPVEKEVKQWRAWHQHNQGGAAPYSSNAPSPNPSSDI